jgi:hypothetical protein
MVLSSTTTYGRRTTDVSFMELQVMNMTKSQSGPISVKRNNAKIPNGEHSVGR